MLGSSGDVPDDDVYELERTIPCHRPRRGRHGVAALSARSRITSAGAACRPSFDLEHRDAIAGDFEAPARGWLHGDRRIGVSLPDRGRQTGGPWLVVSNRAVFNVDLHESLEYERRPIVAGGDTLPATRASREE